MQYDPNVHSQKDLKKGQTYKGETYQAKNKKGAVTTDYRKDGSIFFKSQSKAYARLRDNAVANNREQLGVITKNGVLVTPEYKNEAGKCNPEVYGYNWKKGDLVDGSGNKFSVLGTIHTHLSPIGHPYPSRGYDQDRGYFGTNTPGKVYMTFWAFPNASDKNIYPETNSYSTNEYGATKTHTQQYDFGFSVDDLINGNAKLIEHLEYFYEKNK